ncbi:MAG: DUF3862 domain-containing protein [Candidatus Gracilibacteria bacterium]|jgi:outer membrane protein assembly factor BamE (lipoprotein component of BamABCDE complex)|nr:DUF3862 domain-containing protein [Candidatus Gracilibacteria bacterium]
MKTKNLKFILPALSLLVFSACGAKITNENVQITPETNSQNEEVSNPVEEQVNVDENTQEQSTTSTYNLLLENTAYKAFTSLKMGDSKDTVEKLLGEGKALEKDPFDTSVEPYEYTKDGSIIWINYKDGALVKRAIKENKDWSSAISKEDFAKIKEGMTYEEVKAVLGEGQITSESSSSSGTTITYFWNIKSGYQNVTIKFKDGISTLISNMNMK